VRGQLTELRAADLRFTPSEAAGFLNQAMGLNLSSGDIAALETRTEGWVAGLQMAALSMQGRADTAGFIQAFTGSHRFVLAYLAEEGLHQQPERVRRFLLQTSILERLCGPLCDAVTEQEDGRGMLEMLERENLFVVPLDDKRHWFRYHHLFADVLRARSMEELSGQLPALHLRASEWYERHGSPADAVRHALAAADFGRAAGLIELAWPAMDENFQTATWLSWAKALPEETARTRPVLLVGIAWALLSGGEMEAGEARLREAERWLDGAEESPSGEMAVVDEEQFRFLPSSIATARAYHAQALGNLPGAVKYARQALRLLPEEDHLRRGPAAALLGLASWAHGDLEAAHRAIAEAMANFQKTGSLSFAISGTYGLADIRIAQGRLREAVNIYERSLQLATGEGKPILRGTADLYLGLGDLRRERGDLNAAAEYLLRSEELGEQAALPDWPHRFCLARARLEEARGNLDVALGLLDEAERLYYRSPVPDVRPIAALKARLWIRQYRLAEALDWARERGLSIEDELSYLREFEHIMLARIRIAQYKTNRADRSIQEATELLDRLLKAAEEGGRMGNVIEIVMLQALAQEVQGNLLLALVPLERALALAEPEGYVRIFADEGPPMARLLSEAAAQGILPGYAGRLLSALGVEGREAIEQPYLSPPRTPSAQPLVEPLSERELEILQLIARGLSNREISERLFLALSTVKGHNRNIFGKLEVQRRTEAVARARELGLL
ncbi:MAG: tetratricopeptide repeat protein, partial [Chrysiogenetes bacterium]|nr:tetratricopeptide repeat protein [Chrysiogenetes bacterium]